MKKCIKVIALLSLVLIVATGCGKKEATNEKEIKIGVSPRPHKQIVEFVKEDLKKEGYDLKIIEFTDYIKPNDALANEEIDANFFQHEVYLKDFIKNRDQELVSAGAIHVEPMGLYSGKVKSVDEIKAENIIAIPNDVTNGRRALLILEDAGLIKLDPNAGELATEKDIIDNPLNLEIKPLEAPMIPKMLEDVDGAIINGNYALEANLTLKDAIYIESEDSPYANIIAVRKDSLESQKTKALMKVLQSDKVREHIKSDYDNSIIPSF